MIARTDSPEVSVVVASYNAAPFLASTLNSIVRQTFRQWEAIVVDDGSTDGSAEIAERCAREDRRFTVVRLEDNQGPAVARNEAIERARGRFIAFLDSDDEWLPQKLEKQLAFMKENEYAFTSTRYEKVTADGKRTGKVIVPPDKLSYYDMLKSNQVGCLSAMYDAGKLGKVYMPLIRKRQDYGLWLSLLKRVDFVHCLPEVLALYRVRRGALSTNKTALLHYNWKLFRDVERMSRGTAAYYVGWNILRKVVQ